MPKYEVESCMKLGCAAYDKLAKRAEELEAELANEKGIAAKAYTACGNYQERIKELEDYLVEFGDHKNRCLAIATNNKEYCTCGFGQALKG